MAALPGVCLGLLLLVATTHARPNWPPGIHGTLVGRLLPSRYFNAHKNQKEMEYAVKRLIHNTNDVAKEQLAVMKNKQVDLSHNHFHHSLAPIPYFKGPWKIQHHKFMPPIAHYKVSHLAHPLKPKPFVGYSINPVKVSSFPIYKPSIIPYQFGNSLHQTNIKNLLHNHYICNFHHIYSKDHLHPECDLYYKFPSVQPSAKYPTEFHITPTKDSFDNTLPGSLQTADTSNSGKTQTPFSLPNNFSYQSTSPSPPEVQNYTTGIDRVFSDVDKLENEILETGDTDKPRSEEILYSLPWSVTKSLQTEFTPTTIRMTTNRPVLYLNTQETEYIKSIQTTTVIPADISKASSDISTSQNPTSFDTAEETTEKSIQPGTDSFENEEQEAATKTFSISNTVIPERETIHNTFVETTTEAFETSTNYKDRSVNIVDDVSVEGEERSNSDTDMRDETNINSTTNEPEVLTNQYIIEATTGFGSKFSLKNLTSDTSYLTIQPVIQTDSSIQRADNDEVTTNNKDYSEVLENSERISSLDPLIENYTDDNENIISETTEIHHINRNDASLSTPIALELPLEPVPFDITSDQLKEDELQLVETRNGITEEPFTEIPRSSHGIVHTLENGFQDVSTPVADIKETRENEATTSLDIISESSINHNESVRNDSSVLPRENDIIIEEELASETSSILTTDNPEISTTTNSVIFSSEDSGNSNEYVFVQDISSQTTQPNKWESDLKSIETASTGNKDWTQPQPLKSFNELHGISRENGSNEQSVTDSNNKEEAIKTTEQTTNMIINSAESHKKEITQLGREDSEFVTTSKDFSYTTITKTEVKYIETTPAEIEEQPHFTYGNNHQDQTTTMSTDHTQYKTTYPVNYTNLFVPEVGIESRINENEKQLLTESMQNKISYFNEVTEASGVFEDVKFMITQENSNHGEVSTNLIMKENPGSSKTTSIKTDESSTYYVTSALNETPLFEKTDSQVEQTTSYELYSDDLGIKAGITPTTYNENYETATKLFDITTRETPDKVQEKSLQEFELPVIDRGINNIESNQLTTTNSEMRLTTPLSKKIDEGPDVTESTQSYDFNLAEATISTDDFKPSSENTIAITAVLPIHVDDETQLVESKDINFGSSISTSSFTDGVVAYEIATEIGTTKVIGMDLREHGTSDENIAFPEQKTSDSDYFETGKVEFTTQSSVISNGYEGTTDENLVIESRLDNTEPTGSGGGIHNSEKTTYAQDLSVTMTESNIHESTEAEIENLNDGIVSSNPPEAATSRILDVLSTEGFTTQTPIIRYSQPITGSESRAIYDRTTDIFLKDDDDQIDLDHQQTHVTTTDNIWGGLSNVNNKIAAENQLWKTSKDLVPTTPYLTNTYGNDDKRVDNDNFDLKSSDNPYDSKYETTIYGADDLTRTYPPEGYDSFETFTKNPIQELFGTSSDIAYVEQLLSTEQSASDYSNSPENEILRFTSEIENLPEISLKNEEIPSPGLELTTLHDLNKREAIDLSQTGNIDANTDCLTCRVSANQGHRIKRSAINSSKSVERLNITNSLSLMNSTIFDEKNITFTNNKTSFVNITNQSSFYASTILELLPVIREGYKNNAFNEEDKKVIRSIFGDIRTFMDEESEKETPISSTDLLMGDETSRIDELVEDFDYEGSESYDDSMSDEEGRLKRSKKNWQRISALAGQLSHNFDRNIKSISSTRNLRKTRSAGSPQQVSEAAAILALLAENGDGVQLDRPDDEDDDEYEYYEDDDYSEDDATDHTYEDNYDEPSIGELIKLARKHRERKAMQS